MGQEHSTKPARVFCSYSHEDEGLRKQLNKHLGALRRSKLVEAWHDRKIIPGTVWRSQIEQEIEAADVFLLLVSASFIDSEFCYGIELDRALARYRNGEALVIPIALRPCDWDGTPLAGLQALPTDRRAVTDWTNRDRAFLNVVQGIRRAVESLEEWRAAATPQPAATSRGIPPLADERAATTVTSEIGLQKVLTKVFGEQRRASPEWLRTALSYASAVARIENSTGRGLGTGFLVDPRDFGLSNLDAPILLTCSFVVGGRGGLDRGEAIAFFETSGDRRPLGTLIWLSEELHAALFSLTGNVDGLRFRVAPAAAFQREEETQIILIGHPLGGPLSFSLWHNHWLGYREPRLHYHAATDPGSAGSPVVDEYWRLLALHHSRGLMQRLWWAGTYDACEGTSVLAIRDAIQA